MKTKIGITLGDPAGIGAEVAVKALTENAVPEDVLPIVIGDRTVLEDALKLCGVTAKVTVISGPDEAPESSDTINLIDMAMLTEGDWQYGRPTAKAGTAAFAYIEKACSLAMAGELDAMVTCPVNKAALNEAGFRFTGHTEILGELTGADEFAMLLHGSSMNVIHVTTHVSMETACRMITKDRVGKTIRLAHESMRLMGIEQPRIAVAGFNAHSSENGLFGTQEAVGIIPAVEEAARHGIAAEGPISPDTVFPKAMAGQYDIVVAMYHDQGHIPFKLSEFRYDAETDRYIAMDGVNCTVGLPIIRTSVDHGTAYDRAGKGTSNAGSLVRAIETAAVMAENRKRMGL